MIMFGADDGDDDDMFGGGVGGRVGDNDNDDEFNEDDFGDEDDEGFSAVAEGQEEKDPTALYYRAKESLERADSDDKERALALLRQAAQEIPASDRGTIGAKVHKRLFRALVDTSRTSEAAAEFQAALGHYRGILVPQNLFAEKNLFKMLDTAISSDFGAEFADNAYDSTERMLEGLRAAHLQRLVFRASKRYSQFLLDRLSQGGSNTVDLETKAKLSKVVARMHSCCCCSTTSGSADDTRNKAPQLAEVYALELKLCTLCGDTAGLRPLVEKALSVCTGTSPPRVLGVVKECAGVIAIEDGLWSRARECFFDAFINFNEAEAPDRLACLRRLVLASMLDFSTISPFDSPEARGLASVSELEGVKRLWEAYAANDLGSFEAILESERSLINDSVFVSCKEHLVHSLRLHVLAVLLKPYRRVRVGFLADRMGVAVPECERLLAELIVDNVISARINEPEGIVTMLEPPSEDDLKQKVICDWAENAMNMARVLSSKLLNDK